MNLDTALVAKIVYYYDRWSNDDQPWGAAPPRVKRWYMAEAEDVIDLMKRDDVVVIKE